MIEWRLRGEGWGPLLLIILCEFKSFWGLFLKKNSEQRRCVLYKSIYFPLSNDTKIIKFHPEITEWWLGEEDWSLQSVRLAPVQASGADGRTLQLKSFNWKNYKTTF